MDTATRMSDMPSGKALERLRDLVPLHTLPQEALNALIDGVSFESLAAGAVLMQQGDTDQQNVYLLKGSVVLLSNKAVVERIRAGSDTARFPIAHQLPRKHTVRAESRVQVVRVDSRRLSELLAHSQTIDYKVADFEEVAGDDWMSMLLQSRVLQQVPAANIQQVMMNVEQVEVAEGEDLIRQGDPGDFYYMLTRGRAVVRRDHGDGEGPCDLATLGPGDAFGEEALLSDSPRNSSVTMLQDGEVLRLGKDHFVRLIHNPLLDRLDMQAAQARIDQGATWLDLRSSQQFDESHLPGAINCPFESLRYQVSSLAPDGHYVLYSNTGGRAMAGAYLLRERGFDVSVLEGGLLQRSAAVVQPDAADLPDDGSAPDDGAMQVQIRQLEARARELEQRLALTQRDQQSEVAEREQRLDEVRQAVDQAQRELHETEAQKREALAAQEEAYAEMERLTGSLEALQSERSSLLDRMSEIEGLDKQLQARLAKAERELIGERERAESATSSLEALSQRLSDALEMREQERERHARESGELKEELTALQLDLEQAELDMQELHKQLAAGHGGATADDAAQLEALQQAITALQDERDQLLSERAALQSELAAGIERLTREREQTGRDLAQMRERLATAETQNRRLQQADGREAISHESMRQRIEALESSLHERQRELADAEEVRHRLEDALEDLNRGVDELRLELQQAKTGAAEAEAARDQLREALRQRKDGSGETPEADLRDERSQLDTRPAGGGPGPLLTVLVGAVVALAALEGLTIASGKGELFGSLLMLAGP